MKIILNYTHQKREENLMHKYYIDGKYSEKGTKKKIMSIKRISPWFFSA